MFMQPREAPMTQFAVALLGHVLLLFALLPFVLGLPRAGASYSAYLDAIRLTRVRPLVRLLLLGLSCSLILALCQASGVLLYRALEGRI